MNDLKKRIENIKYWRRWLIISAVFFSCGILQGVFPDLFNSLINIAKAAGDIGILIAFVLLGIGPYFSVLFFVWGLSGLGSQEVRCSKCNTKMSLKELEAMGDEFRCPYCLNDTIKAPTVVKTDYSRAATRTLRRVLRDMSKK